jgi:PcRGLX-like N-terminal RIFT barrel domain
VLRLVAAFLLASVARAAAAPPTPLAVPLVLDETGGVARQAFPASASVPFPRGRLTRPDMLWLAAPDRHAAAFQSRTLERWPDGSVRWLLVDFLADVPSRGHATYTLHDSKPAGEARGPRLQLETHDGARLVDAGALHVRVASAADAPLAELTVGPSTVRLGVPTLTVDGVKGGAPTNRKVAVESDGAVRTELLVTGRYPQGIDYETRIAVFAGQPFVRVQETVINRADAHYAPLRSLALPLIGPFTRGAVGIDGQTRALEHLEPAHELLQIDAVPVNLDGARAGRHGDGWARASGDDVTATVAMPTFWQEYPKAFRWGPKRLELDLFAGTEAPVQFGTGAAKTHELWIAVESGRARKADELAAAVAAPLVALPPSDWIVASHALPQSLSGKAPTARGFLARLATAYAGYRERQRTERWDDGPPTSCATRATEHPRVGLYGALNFGDWQFPGYRDQVRGCDAWGNLEYDLPQVLGLAWAATGARPFFDGLVASARHYRDVDIIHHMPEHPDWVGMNHPHKMLHFAREASETVDLGHTWSEGLITHYCLTGEVRSLEAARGIANVLVNKVGRAKNPRQFGWPMLALAAVYDATNDRRYRDAALEYALAGMQAFEPTPASGDWKMGILADGIAATHAATGDDRLRRWLVSYADEYSSAPGRWADPRYALPLGYVAAVTGQQRYATRAQATAGAMKIGEWGKPLAAMGRTGFRLLAPLADAKIARPGADAGQASAPSSPRARPRDDQKSTRKDGALKPGRVAPRPASRDAR